MIEIIRKFRQLLDPRERRNAVLLFIMILCTGILEAVGVASIMPFLSVLSNPEVIQENSYLSFVYQSLGFSDSNTFLLFLGCVVFVLVVSGLGLKAVTMYGIARFSHMRNHIISTKLLCSYLKHPYSHEPTQCGYGQDRTLRSAAGGAEGPTERYLLPAIYEAVTGRSPADDGLAILGIGGADSMPDSLKVFHELGITPCALADLDFAVNQAIKHKLLAEDDADIQECLRQIQAMAEADSTICIGDNGRPCSNKHIPNTKKPATVFKEWATREEARPIAEVLHHKLRDHGIWLWTDGDIECHLGLHGPKNPTTWAPFREQLKTQPFGEVVADADTVGGLVEWLIPQGSPS